MPDYEQPRYVHKFKTMEFTYISNTMGFILNTMTEDSQYEDYLKEFNSIKKLVKAMDKTHPVAIAYDKLMRELYVSKGSLDCARGDLDDFVDAVMPFATFF